MLVNGYPIIIKIFYAQTGQWASGPGAAAEPAPGPAKGGRRQWRTPGLRQLERPGSPSDSRATCQCLNTLTVPATEVYRAAGGPMKSGTGTQRWPGPAELT